MTTNSVVGIVPMRSRLIREEDLTLFYFDL
ncbi:hypothetical protein VIBNISOn1_490009 [Vibrio nigripulchritudo SOn1]|uniref:Uncharacterized protein n=1 Tax=Vibrio nigripulchritudo SOn1 TaxID=1238450 RepID=A0AAV2VV54_9VIBR|nr:hypothetical protein VIBNISOn1_490009 [Vibrio nigripulchritudo SOn1]